MPFSRLVRSSLRSRQGVVADTRGRKVSYLWGAGTLLVSTLLYLYMWQTEAGLLGWAIASILIGLGFTFFSGAVEAWLVDALDATGHEGDLESVFGRGQSVAGVAMLFGSVAGGVVAQVTNLGVPYIIRAVILGIVLVYAAVSMRDLGFEPEHDIGPIEEVKKIWTSSIDAGFRNPPVRWIMLAAPFTMGAGVYAFYAMQPYLLELYGDDTAYAIAGLAAAIVAGAQIVGGLDRSLDPKTLQNPYQRAVHRWCDQHRCAVAAWRGRQLLGSDRSAGGLGTDVLGHDAGSSGVHQRLHFFQAAGHRSLVRCTPGIVGRCRLSACSGARCRCLELWNFIFHHLGDHCCFSSVLLAGQAREVPGGPDCCPRWFRSMPLRAPSSE